MTYSIEEHKHRFAAWAAGRAANVNGCRFKIIQGKQIIEDANLKQIGENISNLPAPNNFDNTHLEWRESIMIAAQKQGLAFTHGVAAKLINIYLKSIYVCGANHDDPRIKAIHPPVDSVLLDTLYQQNIAGKRKIWQEARKIRWSKLNSVQYQIVISAIKETLPDNVGLWYVEEYWQGYQ